MKITSNMNAGISLLFAISRGIESIVDPCSCSITNIQSIPFLNISNQNASDLKYIYSIVGS